MKFNWVCGKGLEVIGGRCGRRTNRSEDRRIEGRKECKEGAGEGRRGQERAGEPYERRKTMPVDDAGRQ